MSRPPKVLRAVVRWKTRIIDGEERIVEVTLACQHVSVYERARSRPDAPPRLRHCETCAGGRYRQGAEGIEAAAALNRRRRRRLALAEAAAQPGTLDQLEAFVSLALTFAAAPLDSRDPAWHREQEDRREQLHRLANHLGLHA